MTHRPAAVLALLLAAGCGSATPVGTGPPVGTGSATAVGTGSATAVGTGASGGTDPAAGGGVPRTVGCTTARVTASVGQTVRLVDCGAGTTATVENGPVAQTGPYEFRVDAVGTATISVVRKPPACSAGQLCPLYRIADGTVTVVAG